MENSRVTDNENGKGPREGENVGTAEWVNTCMRTCSTILKREKIRMQRRNRGEKYVEGVRVRVQDCKNKPHFCHQYLV